MLKRIMDRRREEEGFTLIELMVVVLVIGILIAIALPTFLGARQRAANRAAQSNLRNALEAAKVHFTGSDLYTGFSATVGESIEPSLTWAGAADPPVGTIAVVLVSATQVLLAAESSSGTFFCVLDDVAVGTTYGQGAAYTNVDAATECALSAWTS